MPGFPAHTRALNKVFSRGVRYHPIPSLICQRETSLASSRRSVSHGAAQKTAHEKILKKRGAALPLASLFLIFSRAVFCAAPRLTERLEEAKTSQEIKLRYTAKDAIRTKRKPCNQSPILHRVFSLVAWHYYKLIDTYLAKPSRIWQ